MLGRINRETNGKRIVRRVLGMDPPKVEVSFEDTGKLAGATTTGFGTYTSVVSADGSITGQGEGGAFTQDGEMIAWKGTGLGKFGERGAVRAIAGILHFETSFD